MPAGQTIQVPISGSSANGRALAYAVNSVSGLTASFHPASNSYLELDTSAGTMRFQLFDDLAPETSARIRGLAEGGFYDGLSFDLVYNDNGFAFAQTGKPDARSANAMPPVFDDEFNTDAIFDTPGLLALSNPQTKDANRSQFFVTGTEARHLDFNNTIFGILVRGGKTLDSILSVRTDAGNKPTSTIAVRSARVVESPTDAVLQIRASSRTGDRRLTVAATDTYGKTRKETIDVRVVPDTMGSPPVLAPIPDVIYAQAGATLRVPIRAINRNLDRYEINAVVTQGSYASRPVLNDGDKTLDIQLDPNYTGPLRFTVGVKDLGAVSRGSIVLQPGQPPTDLSLYDTQSFTIAIAGGRVTGSAPGSLHAYPNVQLDGERIATFKSEDGSASANDFNAQVDWGDGGVSATADVRSIGDGEYGVFGTHTYTRSTGAPLPLRIRVANVAGGAAVTLKSNVVVANALAVDDDTGVVRIEGTNADDDVRLRVQDSNLVIRIGNDERSVALNRVSRITVELFGGNDRFQIDDPDGVLPGVAVDGGDGDDDLAGGEKADTIDAGAGNDRISGNGGDDLINGGDGNDSILGGSGKNKLYGDNGDDRLTGSAGPDVLSGGDGADRLYGRAGDDTLDGGGGTDRLYGEEGNDMLIGGASNDRMYGGSGNDTLYGNAGSDTLDGGDDEDERGDRDDDDVIRSI